MQFLLLQHQRLLSCLKALAYLQKSELKSRAEIKYEAYAKAINIEAKAMLDITGKHVNPCCNRFTYNRTCKLCSCSKAKPVPIASTQAELLN